MLDLVEIERENRTIMYRLDKYFHVNGVYVDGKQLDFRQNTPDIEFYEKWADDMDDAWQRAICSHERYKEE